MGGVAQADETEGRLPRLFHRDLEGPRRRHDAVAPLAVDDREAGGLAQNLALLPGYVLLPHARDIARQAPDPVRVVAGEVAVDEVLADHAGVLLGETGGAEDLEGELAEGLVLDYGHGSTVSC